MTRNSASELRHIDRHGTGVGVRKIDDRCGVVAGECRRYVVAGNIVAVCACVSTTGGPGCGRANGVAMRQPRDSVASLRGIEMLAETVKVSSAPRVVT